ncbi:L,D-transpeptidase family protein [Salmonirosea aquatica]|uniref:L,D-transpeptidase family protein n=1 Tax=Salmonirosea aquatica TaxID=2654236 RepID=A0A7C9FB52_9BACT|nr:L,D-transpeptidase family protein [Cytophagaceae bacterium SJW1-29]
MSVKKILPLVPYLILVFLGVNGCKKKDRFSVTEAEIASEVKNNKNYEKLIAYGKTVGIQLDTANQERDLFRYLEEIGFGHKPEHLRYIEKVIPADTSRIKKAGWELAQGLKLEDVLKDLEPPYPAYTALKNHYLRLTQAGQADSAALVAQSLNTYRWIHRQAQGADRLVLVNIRGAYLVGMDSLGKESLRMKVIVGKADSPTPGIDTYATNVITFPYWNVPKSIAVKEMIPRIQENIYYLERNGIKVIDNRGNVVDEHEIDWSDMNADHFPYRFRQDTGEDNSLGFMKVNIQNPLAIYLHDTNVRTLFDAKQRWRSHGCVRLENPAQLANFIAAEPLLDDNFIEEALESKEEDRKPTTHPLKKKVPTFLYYMPADVDQAGNLMYFKDVYELEGTTL